MSHRDVVALIRDNFDGAFGRDIVLHTVNPTATDRIETVPRFRLSETARALFGRMH